MVHKLFLRIFDCLMWSGTTFFFGIGQGPSKEEKALEAALAEAGAFATGEGEADILASDKFWQAILSGDPGQISKVLGPEMSGINKRGYEAKKTMAEFGNRGGGTNAAMQMTDDKTRSVIDSMISSLTGTAASNLGAGGRGLLSTGVSANTSAFDAAAQIQKQKEAKWNDIFKSAVDVGTAVFKGFSGMGGIKNSPTGTQDYSSDENIFGSSEQPGTDTLS